MSSTKQEAFPYSLTISIPLPSRRLADSAKQSLEVDEELSSSVTRTLSLAGIEIDGSNPQDDGPTMLIAEYRATTNRMLRVAVNGFMESLGVVLSVMSELDKDVLEDAEITHQRPTAYYYDNIEGDQRAPHDSGKPVSAGYLRKLGVQYYFCPTVEDVDRIAEERKYINRDEIHVTPEKIGPDVYQEKLKMFFKEHLHEDEEIRYIKGGSGFFDVRSEKEEWIRIWLEKGDLIVLPAGIFHRFTTDENDNIHAMRLFQAEPKWTPLNRGPPELEQNGHRLAYLKDRDGAAPAAAA
ncbi:1,2-dihydroxy-3-keto-5-methylthiopentene dioxygenase [Ascosphaera atra]|nr:1,2-dihydroxy-3-keto-5-methylthiopentene dioxygenase [Ascosphaera atra]